MPLANYRGRIMLGLPSQGHAAIGTTVESAARPHLQRPDMDPAKHYGAIRAEGSPFLEPAEPTVREGFVPQVRPVVKPSDSALSWRLAATALVLFLFVAIAGAVLMWPK